MPSTSPMIGGEYVVSKGRPPGELTYTVAPVFLSNAMKRWPARARSPQPAAMPLTITRSPSSTGDTVRPPCVVTRPKSSTTERSQSTLPAGSSASSVPPTPNAYTLPVAGSAAGEAQPMRCGGTSRVVDVEAVLPQELARCPRSGRRTRSWQVGALRPRRSAGRGGRRPRPASSASRRAPSRRGSARRATRRSAARARSSARRARVPSTRPSRRRTPTAQAPSATDATTRRGSGTRISSLLHWLGRAETRADFRRIGCGPSAILGQFRAADKPRRRRCSPMLLFPGPPPRADARPR